MELNLTSLVGFILPPFIDLINSRVVDTRLRWVISMAICIALGVVFNLDKLNNVEALLANIGLIFATAQTTFNLYWGKSDQRETLMKTLK